MEFVLKTGTMPPQSGPRTVPVLSSMLRSELVDQLEQSGGPWGSKAVPLALAYGAGTEALPADVVLPPGYEALLFEVVGMPDYLAPLDEWSRPVLPP